MCYELLFASCKVHEQSAPSVVESDQFRFHKRYFMCTLTQTVFIFLTAEKQFDAQSIMVSSVQWNNKLVLTLSAPFGVKMIFIMAQQHPTRTRRNWIARTALKHLVLYSDSSLQIPMCSRWLSWKYFPLVFPLSRRHVNKAPSVAASRSYNVSLSA